MRRVSVAHDERMVAFYEDPMNAQLVGQLRASMEPARGYRAGGRQSRIGADIMKPVNPGTQAS